MRRIYRFLTLAAIALPGMMLTGCGGWEPVPPPVPPAAQRVLLMYDNINDHTYRPFEKNVVAAGKAVAEGALDPDERVIVFHRSYRMEEYSGARSVIYELVRDPSQPDGYRREMLRVYDSGQYDTLSQEVIASVVGDIRNMVPADHYGFAFGSHGKGWVPKDSPVNIARDGKGGAAHPFAFLWEDDKDSLTRDFQGYSQHLDVSEFVDALDEWKWDFIILDDCFMASVETLYDMRDLTDYIIASPTEIIIAGFPYDDVIGILFDDWSENGLKAVAEAFVEAYRADSMYPNHPFATIAVIKMDEMVALAESVKRLGLRIDQQVSSVEGIQYYDGYSRPGHVFYDIDDYLALIRQDTMPTELAAFRAQMERTIVFKDHTEYYFSQGSAGGTIKINSFSGLNVFIPWSRTAPLFPDYQQTAWFKAVYAGAE